MQKSIHCVQEKMFDKEKCVMKKMYYSTQRPIGPGTYPKDGIIEIVNYDSRKYIEEIGKPAWGHLIYDNSLSEQELQDYELCQKENLWWQVTVTANRHGNGVSAEITDIVENVERPEDEKREDEQKVYKIRYFENRESAEKEADYINQLQITSTRKRMSVTQGEVNMYVQGKFVLNFGDKIERIGKGEDYFGELLGDYASKQSDGSFCLGLIWHPYDENYHITELVKRVLKGEKNNV